MATANFGINDRLFKNTENGNQKMLKTDTFTKTYEPCYVFPKTQVSELEPLLLGKDNSTTLKSCILSPLSFH